MTARITRHKEAGFASTRAKKALAAALTTFLALSGVAASSYSASADELSKLQIQVNLVQTAITLDSGSAQAASGTTVDGFDSVVTSDRVAVRETSHTDDTPFADVKWRIVEDGVPTHFWIVLQQLSWSWVPDCVVEAESNGVISPVDPSVGTPYTCGVTDSEVGGTPTATLHVGSAVWESLEGSITPVGALSLDQGHLESANERFFINNQRYRADRPRDVLASGGKTTWTVEDRTGEAGGPGAHSDFWYRILKNGLPTQYWVKGTVYITKTNISYDRNATCEIYEGGEPFNGGTKLADFNPYDCTMDFRETGHYDNHFAVDFKLAERQATVVSAKDNPAEAARLLSAACADEAALTSTCFYSVNSTEDVERDPKVIFGPFDNNDDVPQQEEADFTHTIQNAWSITVTQKFIYDILGSVVKGETWVAIGYSGNVTDGVTIKRPLTIAPHTRGWMSLAEAVVRVNGDFLVDVDGTKYRIEGVTTEMRDPRDSEGGIISFNHDNLPKTNAAPTQVPTPPTDSMLTPEKENGVRAHTDTIGVGEQLHINVGASHAGEWVSPWLHDSSGGTTHLGWAQVDQEGFVTVTVPGDAPAGRHRLSVADADGTVLGWHNITVTRPSSGSGATLAATGIQRPDASLAVGILVLILGGAALALVRRRPNRHTN